MQTLRWNSFSSDKEAFHVAGLSSGQKQEAGEHTHEGFAECFLVVSGRLRHQVNGAEQILRAGQLVMVRESDTHSFQPWRGESFAFQNIAFRTDPLAFICNRYFSNQPDFWGGSNGPPAVWTLDRESFDRMELRISQLMIRPRTQIYIEQFLLDVLTDPPRSTAPAAKPKPDWLERACEALNSPAEFSTGTAALFRIAGRSPEHVSRELKRCTGETPTELVNRLRLEHAARHLLLSGKNITTVAYDCGFETLSYFSGLFKNRFGLTPRDYRKKHRAAVFGG